MTLFSLLILWCLFSANIKSSLAETKIQGGVCRGVMEGRGGGGLYLTLHCHHQNGFCIKMGSGMSCL